MIARTPTPHPLPRDPVTNRVGSLTRSSSSKSSTKSFDSFRPWPLI
jgi:hypothetical protein